MGEPRVRDDGKYSYVWADVKIHGGLSMINGGHRFCIEAERYQKGVYLRKIGSTNWVELKSIMGLEWVVIPEGEHVELRAEGTDNGALEILSRIYSGATSEDALELNFNRVRLKRKTDRIDLTKPGMPCPWAYSLGRESAE